MRASLCFCLGVALLGGCRREAPPAAAGSESAGLTATDVLANVRELASRHRVVEAIEAISAYAAARTEDHSLTVKPLSATERTLWEEWGALLVTASRPEDAVQVLEVLGPGRSSGRSVRRLLARAHVALGEFAEAWTLLEGLRAVDRAELWRPHAEAAAGLGRDADALAIVAAALVADPWLDEGYLVLGRLLSRQSPSNGEVFLERYRAGEEHRQELDRAVEFEFEGQAGRAAVHRAYVERRRGNLFRHMELCRDALAADPKLGPAYLELARLSLFVERPWDALKVLEQLPKGPEALLVTAEAQAATNDVPKARQTLKEAATYSETRDAAAALSRALDAPRTELLKMRRFVRQRLRAKGLSQSGPELEELAAAYRAEGRDSEARSILLFLVRVAPKDVALRERVALALSEPVEAFHRLRLWRSLEGAGAASAWERELERLGIAPDRVRRVLAGERLSEENR